MIFSSNRGDRRVPPRLRLTFEMFGNALAKIDRHINIVLIMKVVDGIFDDLLQPRVVDEEAVGVTQQIGLRDYLLDAVLGELAFDESDQLTRGQSVQLN